jgi:hypothetical protein
LGQETICTVLHNGKSASGKALLETNELILRGDLPLKIPFASIISLNAIDGELHVRTKSGLTVFVLGGKAAKWRERIANPKSLLEKLGPKAGDSVAIIGTFDGKLLQELKKAGTQADRKASGATQWIFVAVETKVDLARVRVAAKAMRGAAALWVIYPKGQKSLTEHDVRDTGLKAGLTDVKVAGFSATHTALKFVIPKAKRE